MREPARPEEVEPDSLTEQRIQQEIANQVAAALADRAAGLVIGDQPTASPYLKNALVAGLSLRLISRSMGATQGDLPS
jgi:hypothetical protein